MTTRLYVRVSTDQQELEGQLRELKEAAQHLGPGAHVEVYQEKVSGTGKAVREQYNHLIRDAASGDIVLVWSLDRFSRAERFTDAINAVLDLEKRGVTFMSLHEPFLN